MCLADGGLSTIMEKLRVARKLEAQVQNYGRRPNASNVKVPDVNLVQKILRIQMARFGIGSKIRRTYPRMRHECNKICVVPTTYIYLKIRHRIGNYFLLHLPHISH